jgi:hypothetical protein
MSVIGTWNVVTETPIGKQTTVVELSEAGNGLRGVARDQWHPDALELREVRLEGDRLRWAMTMTKPLRLELTFDVAVDGDQMAGRAKAGRLLSSKVTGRKVTTED